MTTTYPLPTLAATVGPTGITAPAYTDIYQSLLTTYGSIFGTDSYIDPSSQDGQLLAAVAYAINDSNNMAIAVYNSLSPQTAQGVQLSNAVKINGLSRLVATNSQVNVTLTGVVGTVITNGVVADTNSNLYNLPSSVTIPLAGSIIVTATAQQVGAINAAIGTVTTIQTPQLGWQSVTNATAATAGSPVESDAALRARQAVSVGLPALSVTQSVVASIQAITGVTQVSPNENDTAATNSAGIPPYSISMVVAGGNATAIAQAILNKKSPGCATYGTTNVVVNDAVGIPHTINFFVPTPELITVAVSLHPLTSGYTTAIGTEVQTAIINYINALLIGQAVYRDRLFMPAQLFGATDSLTYNITSILIAISPGSPAASDIAIAFNQQAYTNAANVTITLV